MDENRLKLVRDALNTVNLYGKDPASFMDQLVKNRFNVANVNSSQPTSIFEHFGVFVADRDGPFSSKYEHIFRNVRIPKNRSYWSNYLSQIEEYLDYLSSPNLAASRNALEDRAINSFTQYHQFSEDEYARLQQAQGQTKYDMLDQILRGRKNPKTTYYGSLGPKPIAKTGSAEIEKTTHPWATPEEHQRLKELGLEEVYQPGVLTTPTGEQLTSSGTLNLGQKFLTNAEGERLNTAGPIRQPTVLLGANEKPLTTGMETFQAEPSSNKPILFSKPGSLARRILKPLPGTKEGREEALSASEHELKMGLIKGLPAAESAIGALAGGMAHEVASLGAPEDDQEIEVEEVPVTYQGRSSRGVNISSVRNVPRAIKTVRSARTTAQVAKAARAARLAVAASQAVNPYVIAAVIVILVFFVFIFLPDQWNFIKNTALCGPDLPCGKTQNPISGVVTTTLLEIFKGGPAIVENRQDIRYNITLEYIGPGTANVVLSDSIPEGLEYHADKQDPGFAGTFRDPDAQNPRGIVEWTFNNMSVNNPLQVFLILTPTKDDFYAVNRATATLTRTTGYLGGGDNLLPAPLPDPPPNWEAVSATIRNALQNNPASIVVYQEASSITGVPWQLLAGIHYTETGGGLGPNTSLTNGHPLNGTAIPDLVPAQCGAGIVPGQGVPIPAPGGCTFATQLDSAIYAGNLLISKNLGQPIVTFFDAIRAASSYNGGGNQNCGHTPPSPYELAGNCNGPGPDGADFYGEDDSYAMADFDAKHYDQLMYLMFCGQDPITGRGIRCSPPRVFGRPGVMAVIRAIATAP